MSKVYKEICMYESTDAKELFQLVLKRNHHITEPVTMSEGKLFVNKSDYDRVRDIADMYGLNQ